MSATVTELRVAGSRTGEDLSGKYLTFFLENEEYGLEILRVQEIIGMMPITRVPRTSSHVRGLINLRGKVIPVVDLRLQFGMDAAEQTDESCIIVVQVHTVSIGIIVDRVSEVCDINGSDIEDSPSFGSDVATEYILGIGKSSGQVKILLDIEKVLQQHTVAEIQKLAANQELQEAA
jgi:purine-binding chemotaxis protein CheW